jgi:hypothetical protein
LASSLMYKRVENFWFGSRIMHPESTIRFIRRSLWRHIEVSLTGFSV